jgi:hypothetical protein
VYSTECQPTFRRNITYIFRLEKISSARNQLPRWTYYIPEDGTLHKNRCENLKSYIDSILNTQLETKSAYWRYGWIQQFSSVRLPTESMTYTRWCFGQTILCGERNVYRKASSLHFPLKTKRQHRKREMGREDRFNCFVGTKRTIRVIMCCLRTILPMFITLPIWLNRSFCILVNTIYKSNELTAKLRIPRSSIPALAMISMVHGQTEIRHQEPVLHSASTRHTFSPLKEEE